MADDRFKQVATTNGGKVLGYRPSTDPSKPGLFEICFSTGGELHSHLKGAWSPREAVKAIEYYISALQKPVKQEKTNAVSTKEKNSKPKKKTTSTKTKVKEG